MNSLQHAPPPAVDLETKPDAELFAMVNAHLQSVTWHQDQIDLLHKEIERRNPPDSPLLDWGRSGSAH